MVPGTIIWQAIPLTILGNHATMMRINLLARCYAECGATKPLSVKGGPTWPARTLTK